ncbi:glycosyltransferase [Hyphobacterium sp. HN65]|uniref:Glycosyltransferase n=1 Tax=Hyphobacterium lacteum TaxID=3116575 RepID=A0ABU7LT95_9PROT|nr:glycosyltransferase [Hyphobacterium sp. HN65]MEE2526809.1 glycosyltransferase [Hyphobacterium sp. HN65]
MIADSGLWHLLAAILALSVIAVGLAQNAVYMLQLIIAGWSLSAEPPVRRTALLWRRYSEFSPPIALISPAFNEEMSIEASVRSLLALQYPLFEVIVVNDGSSDATLARLIDAFGLKPVTRAHDQTLQHQPIRGIYASPDFPKLIVIDKENGGKADALNAGINLARAPIICSMDADSILESDALLRAVRPFVEDPERVIAVGGTVRLANGCRVEGGRVTRIGLPRNLLALFQTVEYLRAFLMARLAWSEMGALTIISGAFGLFRRSVVIEAGGYSTRTVGEDMELVVRMHRLMRKKKRAYRIAYVPEPVCWTEAPENLRILGRQRARWQRGSLETFFHHAGMTFNPRYGRVGWLGFPHIFLVDVLGPLIELLGYVLLPVLWALGLLSIEYLLAFLAVSFMFGVTISVLSLVLSEIQLQRFPRASHLTLLALIAVLENFGYRQLGNFWRIRGWFQFATGQKSWGQMTRKGFSS